MTADRKLARDVATELERRRTRRKLMIMAVWAALIVAAILYLRCGRGLLRGGGKAAGPGTATTAPPVIDAGPARCTVRVAQTGITVDGAPMSRDQAVAACRNTDGAMVTVTGDARQGDWEELRAALQVAGVKIYIRGELWDGRDPK